MLLKNVLCRLHWLKQNKKHYFLKHISGRDRKNRMIEKERINELLDSSYDKIMADEVFEGMAALFVGLRNIRLKSEKEEWRGIVDSVLLEHPIKNILFQDPFTYRCFHKPRGYSGDAVILDMIYRHKSINFDNVSDIGKKIHEYIIIESPSCKAVRYRKTYQARMIDEIAIKKNKPNILSIACGHMRELEISDAVQHNAIGKYIGIDHDKKSVERVKNDYRNIQITALKASVKDILTGKYVFNGMDFIYASGIYDYLTKRTAQKLTSILFDFLNHEGQLLIANFMPDIKDIGYMESFLSWYLIYRNKTDMINLLEDIPKNAANRFEIFKEEWKNIIFLQGDKQ